MRMRAAKPRPSRSPDLAAQAFQPSCHNLFPRAKNASKGRAEAHCDLLHNDLAFGVVSAGHFVPPLC
jgi:hypothetical protein